LFRAWRRHRDIQANASATRGVPLALLDVVDRRHEHDPDHDAQKKKRNVSQTGQLWKYHALIIQPA